MDRLSPVVLWMDAADGYTETSTQQQGLADDVEMNELLVSVPDSVAAVSLSSPGVDAAGISDLASCRLALEQAQRVRRTNDVCVLLLCHFAFLILYLNRQTCGSWRRITRCEWCGCCRFFFSRIFSYCFPRPIRRFVTLGQQLRAATTPVPLVQQMRSYARALFFGRTGYFTACSLMLIVAAALGFAITMGQFGSYIC
jgi:hypothetical protein